MVSPSLLLRAAATFAAVATAGATDPRPLQHEHQHHRISVKLHEGNVTVKILDIDAAHLKAVTDKNDAAPYRGKNNENCYYNKDTDHPGNDVGNKKASDYHQCNDLCVGFKGCTTWSWSNHEGGTCWLKSRIGGDQPKQGTVSLTCELYVEKLTSDCRAYPDIDFVGNDIGSKPGKFGDCCSICTSTHGCSAYAWNNDHGGTCYLKSSVGHVVYKHGVTSSSTKPLYGEVCPFQYDTVLTGDNIGKKPAKDAGVCCSLCKENKVCRAYSWSNHNGGTCWMKSGSGEKRSKSGVISAVLYGYN